MYTMKEINEALQSAISERNAVLAQLSKIECDSYMATCLRNAVHNFYQPAIDRMQERLHVAEYYAAMAAKQDA